MDGSNAVECNEKEFCPDGMRILAVDDNIVCLRVLQAVLQRCRYKVTITTEAATALKLLREGKNNFDLVITDVHMLDMDGFRLLEIISLEMELPVIMMSSNDDTNMVLKGIKHGACDYLLKPIRKKEIQNIWQHVIRKTLFDSNESTVTKEVTDQNLNLIKRHRKQIKEKENSTNTNSDGDSSMQKKQRVTWTAQLHNKFIAAIYDLGIDKAVPKKILELLNEPELSRENVASHLQKYRNALKKQSSTASQQSNNNIDSNGMGGQISTTTISSFNDQDPNSSNCIDGSRVNGYRNFEMIQFGHRIQNPCNVRNSFANPKSLLLPLNQQGNLLQQYLQVPKIVDQMQQRTPITGLRDAPLNSFRMDNLHHQSDFNEQNYQCITPRPILFDDHMENSSHIPSYNASSGLTPSGFPLHGCATNVNPNNVFFGGSGSSCTLLTDFSTELSTIIQPDSLTGPVQNLPPGKHEQIVASSGREDLDFMGQITGVPFDMQSSSMEHFLESDLNSMHLPLNHLETEYTFHPNNCNSMDEDLNAALRQFQQ